MALVQIVHNAVTAKIVNPDRELKSFMSQLLRYKVVDTDVVDTGGWDGYSSFFEMRPATFPAGFIRLVKNALSRDGYKVMVKGKTPPKPQGPENPVVDDFEEDPRYDYQRKVPGRLISLRGMIARVATGGGKSRIFKLCAERLDLPTLFVTTRKSLAYQMANTYEQDIGKPYGFLGDGKWRPYEKGVNFAIVDTLVSRLEPTTMLQEARAIIESEEKKIEKKIQAALKKADLPHDLSVVSNPPPKLLDEITRVRRRVVNANPIDKKQVKDLAQKRFERKEKRRQEAIDLIEKVNFVTFEEAHEVSGDGFYSLSMALKNAHYRLSLTATPFLKDSEGANMRLMAATGPVGIEVSEKMLIDRGILAKPYFKYEQPEVPPKLRKTTPWQSAYAKGIVENYDRNMRIARNCLQAHQYGLTSMVLIQHSRHGHMLKKLIGSLGLRVDFIYGDKQQDEREHSLERLRNHEIDVLIGSTILDVGIDVPSIGLVCLAGGGKPEVGIRQRIGRGLRAKKDGPNVCLIVDFDDRGNKHLKKHSKERRRIVEQTPGFGENIVERFDFEGLKFKRVA